MSLTQAQTAAVKTEARDVLVVAPAGSGKTRTLIARIDELIFRRGVSPSSICVLTFTRKAAAEMQQRLRDNYQGHDAKAAHRAIADVTMGTFHSVALRILKADARRIGYAPNMTVIDQDDSDMLIKMVATDFGWYASKKWKHGLSGDKVKQYLERFHTTGELGTDDETQRPKAIVVEYISRLYAMNCLDFGSILTEVNRLFNEHPDVLERYRSTWRYLLIDEGQDMNLIQHVAFMRKFCPPAELFIVADVRQAIYSFRGSRPDLLVEFVNGSV